MPSTKIDLNHSRISRLEGLDDLARILFPGNKKQQGVFLVIFVAIKWAPGQFVPTLDPMADAHDISRRALETVRAKMRRLGIIDHVSRFNKTHGYREGWVFSGRFKHSLIQIAEFAERSKLNAEIGKERKDRDAIRYI